MPPTQPEDVINEALGEIGASEIGDLTDGSAASVRALRVYDTTLRELHATANWNFARRQHQLDLIGDANGIWWWEKDVPLPWLYAYEWPVDCVHMRWVLGAGASALDPDTLKPVGGIIAPCRPSPVPFIVSDYPRVNPVDSSWDTSEGHNPESTRVVLTNELGAICVYTRLVMYPDAWDPLFRRAMVTRLAARLALAVVPDKKLGAQLRDANLAIAKEALIEARVRDGNEGWTKVDLYDPDWITIRSGSRYGGPGGYY